jgi:hypothetical protein
MDNNKILKSFKTKNNLNPEIWDLKGDSPKMKEEVRNSLIEIANTFIDFLGFDLFVQDITMTGSLSNYNWSDYSDIDLHIMYNFNDTLDQEELFKDLFKLKKTVFNSTHDITVKGYEVELYVQDSNEPHFSTGVYSVLFDEWMVEPEKVSTNIDTKLLFKKAECWMDKIDNLVGDFDPEDGEETIEKIGSLQDKLKDYRGVGLEKEGEYSYENLVFKFLRRNGYIQKLFDFKNNTIDKILSI